MSVTGRQMRGPYAQTDSLYAPQGVSIRYYLYFMHRELGRQGAALVPGKNAMVGKVKTRREDRTQDICLEDVYRSLGKGFEMMSMV